MMFVVGLWAAAVAHATPTTVVHQGRLLDASGVGVQGSQGATFRLYPSQDAVVGTDVWEETGTLQLVDGYYTVVLGNDTPLDSALLASNLELWLEVDLDSAPLQRARLHAVPYALSADGARTLTRSDCNAGEVLQFDGAEWVCALNAGGGNGSFQSFFNTTSGWPGCASAQQKWTRIGDAIIYSVNCLGTSPRSTGRAGNITAPHSAVGTPTWAQPSSTVTGSFVGATDSAPLAGATGGADGPLNRAMATSVDATGYTLGGFGSFGGQDWTSWASNFTVVYHVTMQSSFDVGSEANPGLSCTEVAEADITAGTAVYWIDPDGVGPVQPERILCDMDTPNGPWTVLQWDTVAFQQSPAHGVVNADAPGWAVGYAESGNYWNALTTTGFYIELEGATKYVWEDVVLHGTSNRPTPGFLFTGGRVQSWGCDAAGTNGQCHITDQATGRHWGQWVNQTGCCGQGAGTWYYSEASGENNLNYGMCEHLYPNGDVGSSQGCADFTSISPPGSQVFRFAIRH